MKKLLVCFVVFLIALVGCNQTSQGSKIVDGSENAVVSTPADNMDEHVLARIGDDVILESDMDAILSQVPDEYRARFDTPEARKEILEKMVDVKVLAWEAKNRGIDNKAEVKLKLEYLKDQILASELEKDLLDEVSLEDADLKEYYNGHKDEFASPMRVKARHILIKDDQKKAEEILEKLKKGGDFAVLARDNSDCPSKTKGGELGWFSKGRMDPAFEKAAFSLKKGETSGVVKSSFGYHIIQVEDIKPKAIKEFDKVKASIEANLKKKRQEKIVSDAKDKIKDKIKVEINEGVFKTSDKETGKPISAEQGK
ncbi:MAG: peptidylprolyl isomerase [Thermodesulfobacteriota bacterium]|nr:peptidylprolyl isomerase [Thermodesulfobacteriota bacterium]